MECVTPTIWLVTIDLSVLGPPVQIAYSVPDVDAAAARWAADFGVGPFFIRRHIESHDAVYRGAPAVFDHSSAYGQWGSLMVELIQDHGTAQSVVRERYGVNDTGLHHMAFIVPNLEAATAHLESLGFELAMSARSTNTRYHFMDTVAALGHMVELYERSDRLESFYASVRNAAAGWTGDDPLHPL
jgi:Glyoxalase/Bleomycin resistance protein/Dioxygenase superfamily